MAVKASTNVTYYDNEKGPRIGTLTRRVIEKDGLYFKDIDGRGEVTKVNDWRMGKYPGAVKENVPGYDKDLYMPEDMKDENGKAYAYRDATGNYYELNFGLSY